MFLDRYFGAARAQGADTVARVTAIALSWPSVIDRVIDRFAEGDADSVSTTV